MDQLTSYQISEWEAYSTLDPIGSLIDDFRVASIESVVTNCFIGAFAKKGTKATAPIDFMPDWSGEIRESKKQTPEQMKEVFLSLAKTRDKKKGIQPKQIRKKRQNG